MCRRNGMMYSTFRIQNRRLATATDPNESLVGFGMLLLLFVGLSNTTDKNQPQSVCPKDCKQSFSIPRGSWRISNGEINQRTPQMPKGGFSYGICCISSTLHWPSAVKNSNHLLEL